MPVDAWSSALRNVACRRPRSRRSRSSPTSARCHAPRSRAFAESGRERGGAIRYATTPLFERVFGLQGLSELPRLDDLAGDADELRARLEEVAGRRGA